MKKNLTALIVEDSKILSEIISYHLNTKFKFNVFTFENGDDLVANIDNLNPDLIILDYNFNDDRLKLKNGLEVLVLLRKTSNVPVIVFSGKDGRNRGTEFLDSGANSYVSKDGEDFLDRLMNSIEEIF